MTDPEDDASDPPSGADPQAQAREEVEEALARSAEVYGAKGSYGRLYGVLFFADEPLSLDELVEESGYAKSTVSTAMSALERFHLVNRRSIPGEGKKAYFEAERDFWYVLREFVNQEVRREIGIMSRALANAEALLEAAPDDPGVERDLQRVRELKQVYDRSERLIDLLSRIPVDRLIGILQRADRNGGE